MEIIQIQLDGSLAREMMARLSETIADHIENLPRVTEPDGSEWIDANHILALIETLRI